MFRNRFQKRASLSEAPNRQGISLNRQDRRHLQSPLRNRSSFYQSPGPAPLPIFFLVKPYLATQKKKQKFQQKVLEKI